MIDCSKDLSADAQEFPPRTNADASGCPACGSVLNVSLEKIELKEQHAGYSEDLVIQQRLTALCAGVSGGYQMQKCGVCGLEYAVPLRSPGTEWYGLVYEILDLYPSRRWEFDFVLQTTPRDKSIGEFGCGNGEFLRMCRDAGLTASGVDFAQPAVEACRKAGLDAKVIDLDREMSESVPEEEHDVVVAFQVLEHVENPKALFFLARRWARRGGRLWVAVPSDERPSRAYREHDYLDQPPHHMTRWTRRALESVAEDTGWRFARLIREPMDARTEIWWRTTRLPVYKFAAQKGLLKASLIEKFVRSALLPLAWWKAWTSDRMSGQTMLAEYTKD